MISKARPGATTPVTTGGRFDTSKFNNAPQGALDVLPQPEIKEIVELKRGMEWLNREMPGLQTFARVITRNDKIKVMVGPMSCTDGRDAIYIQPQRIAEGAQPGPQHMAHLYHEIAH